MKYVFLVVHEVDNERPYPVPIYGCRSDHLSSESMGRVINGQRER